MSKCEKESREDWLYRLASTEKILLVDEVIRYIRRGGDVTSIPIS